MPGEAFLDGDAAEPPAGPVREQRLGRLAAAFERAGRADGDGGPSERCDRLFAALAVAGDVRSGAGIISPPVFPAIRLVGFGGREPVAEGDGKAFRRAAIAWPTGDRRLPEGSTTQAARNGTNSFHAFSQSRTTAP